MDFARNYARLCAMMDMVADVAAHRFSDAGKKPLLAEKARNYARKDCNRDAISNLIRQILNIIFTIRLYPFG